MMNLEKYLVSTQFGFLLPQPMETLPEYFQPWNSLADNMTFLITSRTLREEVKKVELLDHTRLEGHRQLRLAHFQLSLITSGYVWQDGEDGVLKNLPASIAIPLAGISDILGFQPIASQADMALANYKIVDPQKPLSLRNLRCIYHLPGGKEADWFFLIIVQAEIDFIPAVQAIVDALEAAVEDNVKQLTDALKCITSVLCTMKNTSKRLHDDLSAETFYDVLRPFLFGWGGSGSPLPDGLVYEGVDCEPKQLAGSSAAQSCCLPSIDALLGVSYEKDLSVFFKRMRSYMISHHRRFIETINEKSRVREFVSSREDPSLTAVYNECIQALVDFRSYHIQIVTKYIVVMSHRKSENNNYKEASKIGTAGSSVLPFLKSARDATLYTKITAH